MEANMELAELKAAWHSLERRLEQDNALRLQELRSRGSDRVRGQLRPLYRGQLLQAAFAVAMMASGIACWTGNLQLPLLFGAGVVIHLYGVLVLACAIRTLLMLNGIDFGQPVLAIQSRLASLRHWHLRSGSLSGLAWWVLWVPMGLVLIGISPLPTEALASGDIRLSPWLWSSVGVGVAGLLSILGFYRWASQPGREALRRRIDDFLTPPALREAQAQVAELARFERE